MASNSEITSELNFWLGNFLFGWDWWCESGGLIIPPDFTFLSFPNTTKSHNFNHFRIRRFVLYNNGNSTASNEANIIIETLLYWQYNEWKPCYRRFKIEFGRSWKENVPHRSAILYSFEENICQPTATHDDCANATFSLLFHSASSSRAVLMAYSFQLYKGKQPLAYIRVTTSL